MNKSRFLSWEKKKTSESHFTLLMTFSNLGSGTKYITNSKLIFNYTDLQEQSMFIYSSPDNGIKHKSLRSLRY